MKKTPRNNRHATSACVHCRKRKTRCDGEKPACTACVRRSDNCEYTPDSDRRTARGRTCAGCDTRVPALEEEVAQLRALVLAYEASVGPLHRLHEKFEAAGQASSAAPSQLGAGGQYFLPGEPFNLFPLAGAQILEGHPVKPTPAPGQLTIEPRWLQDGLFLPALAPGLDPLSGCSVPALPDTQIEETEREPH